MPSNTCLIKRKSDDEILMYSKKIKGCKSATHLAIVQNVNGKPDIEEKINLGRKQLTPSWGEVSMGNVGSNHRQMGIKTQIVFP